MRRGQPVHDFGVLKKWVPLEKVREDCGVSRDGSTASSIVKAARAYGLETKAHRYSPESTKTKVHYPAIIHWNFNHFVVLCGFAGDKVVINDPARGTVKVSMEEYDHSFTGVCLEFEPGPNFQPEGKRQSVLTFVAKRLKKTVAPVLFVMLASALCALVGLVTPAFSRVFTDKILTGQNPDWSAPSSWAFSARYCSWWLPISSKSFIFIKSRGNWPLCPMPISCGIFCTCP